MPELTLQMPARDCNIAIVASEFNHFIVQQLVDGAFDALPSQSDTDTALAE